MEKVRDYLRITNNDDNDIENPDHLMKSLNDRFQSGPTVTYETLSLYYQMYVQILRKSSFIA